MIGVLTGEGWSDVVGCWYICVQRAKLVAEKKYKDYGSLGQECEQLNTGLCNTSNYPVLITVSVTSNVFNTMVIISIVI